MPPNASCPRSTLLDVEAVIARALLQDYPIDPLVGVALSYWLSVLRSTVSRHGLQIQRTIAAALEANGRFRVFQDERIVLSRTVLQMASRRAGDVKIIHAASRTLTLDLLIIDLEVARAIACECKRGLGKSDGRRRRLAELEFDALGIVLPGLLRARGVTIGSVETRFIDYYGCAGFSAARTITKDDLDAFFDADVASRVERMTNEMRAALVHAMPPWFAMAACGRT